VTFSLRVAREVGERLSGAGCVAAGEETEEMLAAAPDTETLLAWVSRREDGEPLAWITGRLIFCGQSIHVDPGVYVPRMQTEELAARAANRLRAGGRAADLCTGTGAVGCHLSTVVPDATVVGSDIDARAAACARRNGLRVLVGDLDGGLADDSFDVVTAVTPYVPTDQLRWLPADVQRYEPRSALDGGPDGLQFVRRLVEGAARLLRSGGWLLTEIGGDQHTAVESILAGAGFDGPDFWSDEDGDLRGVAARRIQR
jgi:release factor glutamine methyltransferase